MDFILLIKAVVMGIVEGVTELLPISSTGHLILAADLMNFLEDEKRTLFEIFIQMGAMLAIVWEYRRKIFGSLCGAVHPGVERKAEESHRQQEQRRRTQRPALLFAGEAREIGLAHRASSINSRIRRIAFSRPTKTASPIR